MKRNWTVAAGLALLVVSFVAPMAVQADSISGVVAARAKMRAGGPLTPHDRAMLSRWGTGGSLPEIGSRRGGHTITGR